MCDCTFYLDLKGRAAYQIAACRPKGRAGKLNMSDTPDHGSKPSITFRVVGVPAGWRIIGADGEPMSTLYLSRKLAAEHARELAAVLKGYGQQARVVVEGECTAE
jgi:hypothetical protein